MNSIRKILSATIAVLVLGMLAAVLIIRPERISFGSKQVTPQLTDEQLLHQLSSMRRPKQSSEDQRSERANSIIKFGKALFFDKGLSSNGTVSCATCHDPTHSFTDQKTTSIGIGVTAMNAPTLINMRDSFWFFWNGRADSLEAQAFGPLENKLEHGFSRVALIHRIETHYKDRYESIFGAIPESIKSANSALPPPTQKISKISDQLAAYALATLGASKLQKNILRKAQSQNLQPIEELKQLVTGQPDPPNEFDQLPEPVKNEINQMAFHAAHAIAEFERTIHTEDSPFDQFIDRATQGKSITTALSAEFGVSELNGLKLFTGRGRCTLCHQGSHFTDQQFHNIGLPSQNSESLDIGRSLGVLLARDHEFNCFSTYAKSLNQNYEIVSESCRELQFIQTENSEFMGAFKTPTLRNLKFTAPYAHDGRFSKISDILLHYSTLKSSPAVGHKEESLAPLNLSAPELRDLEMFLLSLSAPVTYFKDDAQKGD